MHSSVINSGNLAKGPRIIYPTQYFLMFDAIFNDATSITKELQKELMDQYAMIKKLAIGDCSADHELFPEFLRRLDDFLLLSNGPNNYKNELLSSLLQCVANNPTACVSHWQQMYRAHFHSSSILLRNLDDNWKTVIKSKQFKESSSLSNFFELLSAFKEYNDSCPTQKDGLIEASKACKSLLKKLSTELNGSNAWFPWKISSFLLLAGIISLINRDVIQKGSFKLSCTGLFLQDIGIYDQTVGYYHSGVDLYAVSKEWTQKELPIYYQAAKENAGPFVANVGTKMNSAWNEGKKGVSHFIGMANEYVPGLNEKLLVISNDASKIANDVLDWLYEAVNLLIKYVILFAEALLSVLKQFFEFCMSGIRDIINGKIDLSDLYAGSEKMFKKAIVQVGEYYEYAKNHISVQLK